MSELTALDSAQTILPLLAGLAAFLVTLSLIALCATVGARPWRTGGERLMRWSVRLHYAVAIKHANFTRIQPVDLWLMRWLIAGAIFAGGVLLLGSLPIAILLAVLAWLAFGIWLNQCVSQHQAILTHQLPEFLDLLVLGLSAGLNLQTSVQLVLTYQSRNELSRLWQGWLLHLRSGNSRVAAFQSFLDCVQAPALRRVCVALIQAEQAGSGIATCLQVHSQQIRQALLLQAERCALQAPVKMLLPLVICFFPSTFLVLGFSIFINLGEFLD